jgi:hypothetical protein
VFDFSWVGAIGIYIVLRLSGFLNLQSPILQKQLPREAKKLSSQVACQRLKAEKLER